MASNANPLNLASASVKKTAAQKAANAAAEKLRKIEADFAAAKAKAAEQVMKAQKAAAKEAAKAEHEAKLASLGVPSIPKAKKLTPAERLKMMMAKNKGEYVNQTEVAKAAAAVAFQALSSAEKVRFLEAKAAHDIAIAEQRLADFKERTHAKLQREIAAIHKEEASSFSAIASSSSNAAAIVVNAAIAASAASPAASARRTTQQVYNNTMANLHRERTRKNKKDRGITVSVSPPKRRKTSSERIANLEKKAAESMARIKAQQQKAANRSTAKLNKQKATAESKAALAAYLRKSNEPLVNLM